MNNQTSNLETTNYLKSEKDLLKLKNSVNHCLNSPEMYIDNDNFILDLIRTIVIDDTYVHQSVLDDKEEKNPLYFLIADRLRSYKNCLKSGVKTWEANHYHELRRLERSLPHGCGIDGKVEINTDIELTYEHFIIDSEYHCMNSDGFYCGWITFRVDVRPSWDNIDVSINIDNLDIDENYLGKEYDELSLVDHLHDVFYHALLERY